MIRSTVRRGLARVIPRTPYGPLFPQPINLLPPGAQLSVNRIAQLQMDVGLVNMRRVGARGQQVQLMISDGQALTLLTKSST